MAKIGRRFEVRFQEYDRAGAVLRHEYTGYFGLSVGSITSETISNGNSNLSWFTDKVESDVAFLGMTMPTWPGNTSPIRPDAWLPLCKIDAEAEFIFSSTNCTWRILFGDNDRIDFYPSASQAFCHWGESFVADFQGGGNFNIAFFPAMNSIYSTGTYSDGYWGRAFVVDKMTDDGHIPVDETVGWATYKIGLRKSGVNPNPEQNPDLSISSGGNMSSNMISFWNYIIDKYALPVDPYAPGGNSGPAMGDGTFDFSSEPVDFQAAPTIGAYDTGMVSMYVPSAADLRSLAAYLWSGPFDPQNFRKLVADPMDAIIGLSILPLTAAEIGTTAATLEVGNVSTGLSMPRASRQYVVVDCGTVNVLPKWGAYLDFSPYSKLQLFLPYIGYVDISPDDCMNGSISVRYTVDLLSGTCVVQVKCLDHVLYEFAGTCSCSCPVTAGQYQNVVTSALKLGSALASSVTSLGGMLGALDDVANTAVSAAKPAISRSGGFGGSSGLMGHQVPYLILTVPRMCTPGDQDQMIGYPSYVTKTLGDLSGYVQVDTIHLAGVPASQAEQEEITNLLMGGVYL